MANPQPLAALDPCPSSADILPRLLALLPRGRAWGTHDGGPWPGSVLHGFWAAFADLLAYANTRICALRAEFFCATQSETNDRWMADYGLPDMCDPFADLCVKVAAAVGGSRRFEYLVALAALAGWTISIARTGACAITITVHTGSSTSYVAGAGVAPRAGRMRAGWRPGCPNESVAPVVCILDRLLPAHCAITYASAP